MSNGFAPRLLQASPELLKLLGEEDDESRNMQAFIPPAATIKPASKTGVLPSVSKGRGQGLDTPRGLGEEELTEDELLRLELEKVKNERNVLLHSISVVKAQAGAGHMHTWTHAALAAQTFSSRVLRPPADEHPFRRHCRRRGAAERH